MNQLTISHEVRLASRPAGIPIVEGENDELVGRPQKKLLIGQTKGVFYVS
jgi:hypothetical protein